MRRPTGLDLALGMFAFVLMYIVISTNSPITGFVIGPPTTIELVSPADATETTQTSTTFMFTYPQDINMKQCSLVLEDKIVKTTTMLLSASGSRMTFDLKPGTYSWRIECIDSNDVKIDSLTRTILIITPQEAVGLQKIPGSTGFYYEFVLKDGLVLTIPDVRPGDIIRPKRGADTYMITVLLIAQDYNRGLTFTELLVTPGDKRIMLNPGSSTNIDFNNDDINDLSLSLDSIAYERAIFTATCLEQAKAETSLPDNSQSTPSAAPNSQAQSQKSEQRIPTWSVPKLEGNYLVVIALIITLILLIVIVVLVKNKASKGRGFIEGVKEDALAVQAELMKGKKKRQVKKKKK